MSDSKVYVVNVARNEAERYWRSALSAWQTFADEILVMDDHSEDETRAMAEDAGATILDPPQSPMLEQMWGNEGVYRKKLWQDACEIASAGDILFFLDADMCPVQDPSEYFELDHVDVWAFVLYDLWAEHETHLQGQVGRRRFDYRDEEPYWKAHERGRDWAVRLPEASVTDLPWELNRGIHTGHIPSAYYEYADRGARVPDDYGIAHYSYLDPADRRRKFEQYMDVENQLRDFEADHARSIIDDKPKLRRLDSRVPEELMLVKEDWEYK